jgi:hypothetical protein
VAARFLLQAIGVESRGFLVGLTMLFLINIYWFSYLVFRDRPTSPTETDSALPQAPVNAPSKVAEPQDHQVPPEA